MISRQTSESRWPSLYHHTIHITVPLTCSQAAVTLELGSFPSLTSSRQLWVIISRKLLVLVLSLLQPPPLVQLYSSWARKMAAFVHAMITEVLIKSESGNITPCYFCSPLSSCYRELPFSPNSTCIMLTTLCTSGKGMSGRPP